MSWEAKSLRIFVDAHSIEIFLNEGELVMTALAFPNSPWKNIGDITGLNQVTIYQAKR